MNAEIIAVGTELLLGQIANTNGAYLAQKLAGIGVNVYYQTVVGDNPKRLQTVFEGAQKRSDLVILIGGLGPTKDDLTKQVVAKALHVELATDTAALEKITAFQKQSGRLNTANNRLQALKLADAESLPNETGFAVGDYYRNPSGADVVLLPGPPSEFTIMVDRQLMPRLMEQGTENGVIFFRRSCGLSVLANLNW
nr:molybdopterin-binding protein [Secundilactobacillus collinoides]